MKKKNIPPAVPEFEDTHDGEQEKVVYLAALESKFFVDPVQPLQIFTDLRTAMMQVSDYPAKVVPIFEQYTADMTDVQKLFVAKKVRAYFLHTVFRLNDADEESEGVTLTGIVEPLSAYVARLERATLPQVADIRAALKEVFRKEIERLPETLATLDDKDRLHFLCKVMPFVLPKVEAVQSTKGEPGDWNYSG